MFEQAYEDSLAYLNCVKSALASGELERPTPREAIAHGSHGNGLQGLNRYEEAEVAYRNCMSTYHGLPGPLSAISVAPTNFATCLWLQGKLDEAERLLNTIIVDRDDVSSYR